MCPANFPGCYATLVSHFYKWLNHFYCHETSCHVVIMQEMKWMSLTLLPARGSQSDEQKHSKSARTLAHYIQIKAYQKLKSKKPLACFCVSPTPCWEPLVTQPLTFAPRPESSDHSSPNCDPLDGCACRAAAGGDHGYQLTMLTND